MVGSPVASSTTEHRARERRRSRLRPSTTTTTCRLAPRSRPASGAAPPAAQQSHSSRLARDYLSLGSSSVPRAVVSEVPGSDPLALGPLHAEVFLEPLIEVRHMGRSVEDRDLLLTHRQLLLENLDARLIAVLHEQPVDRPAEADIAAGIFELLGHQLLELVRVQEVGQTYVRGLRLRLVGIQVLLPQEVRYDAEDDGHLV